MSGISDKLSRVNVTGLRSDKGTVLVQLASSAEDYDEDERAFRAAAVKSTDEKATVVFADVPYGEYAVKLFQDENENRKIDIGFLGPKEPYGFSNNVFGTFGPPPFEQAKFPLTVRELTITIETR